MKQHQDIKSIVDNTYSRGKYQIDKEYNTKLTEARSNFAARGAYHSGAMIKRIAELEKERVRKLGSFSNMVKLLCAPAFEFSFMVIFRSAYSKKFLSEASVIQAAA